MSDDDKKTDNLTFLAMLSVLQGGMWLLNDIETFLIKYNLSHGRFSILLAITDSQAETVLPAEIARTLGKSKPTITRMISRLEKDKLIRIQQPYDDGRKKKLVLTEKGRKLLDLIIPVYIRRLSTMSTGLTKNDKKQLIKLISRINFIDQTKKIRTEV